MTIVTKITDYLIGAKQELKKVVWPSRREITQHTIMVIGISLAVAFFLGVVVDYTLTALLEVILKI